MSKPNQSKINRPKLEHLPLGRFFSLCQTALDVQPKVPIMTTHLSIGLLDILICLYPKNEQI